MIKEQNKIDPERGAVQLAMLQCVPYPQVIGLNPAEVGMNISFQRWWLHTNDNFKWTKSEMTHGNK